MVANVRFGCARCSSCQLLLAYAVGATPTRQDLACWLRALRWCLHRRPQSQTQTSWEKPRQLLTPPLHPNSQPPFFPRYRFVGYRFLSFSVHLRFKPRLLSPRIDTARGDRHCAPASLPPRQSLLPYSIAALCRSPQFFRKPSHTVVRPCYRYILAEIASAASKKTPQL
jgi:hypothetical protein